MNINDMKPGMRVVFIDERLNCGSPGDRFGSPDSNANELAGKEMLVVVVRPGDTNGKLVGVAVKQAMPTGHTCDGLVPKGHGVWVLPEQLYSLEEYEAHVAECGAWAEKQKESQAMVSEFLSEP